MSANATAYSKRYALDRVRGIYRGYVDAGPARDTITALLDAGYTATAIGRAAGLPHDTITSIANGRPHIWQATARAATGLTHAQVIAATTTNGLIPRAGAVRRIRALQAIGWTVPAIAQHAGLTYSQVASVVDSWAAGRNITKALHDTIADTFTRLAMTPGPDARVRTIATRRGWAPPLAWDDIDDPTAVPDVGQVDTGRRQLHLEDLQHLLDTAGPWTWDGITERLNVSRNAIEQACLRADRLDLSRRIHTATDATRTTNRGRPRAA